MTGGLADGEIETAGEMARALASHEVRAAELAERALRRAEAWQPSINAFSQLWADQALQAARSFDTSDRASGGTRAGGVLLAVKDLYDVVGSRTTGCCAAYQDAPPAERDAPMIERARMEGLVMVGKTNQHELAAGGTNLVSACGRTGNPWDPDRMTGGSSGGSAAAVAAGIVPWSFGSDTGGSIRIPSSMCGIFGLKPTTGALSIEGLLPLSPSLDCPGPMASTAEDLRVLAEVMFGRPLAAGEEARDAPERRYRVGLPDGFFAQVHADTRSVVEATAGAFQSLGADVEPVDGSGIDEARRVWMDVCTPEFAEAHPLLKDSNRRAMVAPSVVEWLEQGERLTPEERARAGERRTAIGRWFQQRLEGFHALLIPTTAYPPPAPGVEEIELRGLGRVSLSHVGPGWITCSVNLAGLPALNLPAGRSANGLPVGVSLVGHEGAEPLLLRMALLWQRGVGYRPPIPTIRPPG